MRLGHRIVLEDAFKLGLEGYALFVRKETDSQGNERIIEHCIGENNQVEKRELTQ